MPDCVYYNSKSLVNIEETIKKLGAIIASHNSVGRMHLHLKCTFPIFLVQLDSLPSCCDMVKSSFCQKTTSFSSTNSLSRQDFYS